MSPWIDSELTILRQWIVEREAVRAAKEGGQPKPWTNDVLLRDFRWCNVRRMDDRVSRELMERWYPLAGENPERLLRFALYARLVNWPEALDAASGDLEALRSVLRGRAMCGLKVFTGAYLVPGVPGRSKVDSICDLVEKISATPSTVLQSSMRDTWAALLAFDGMGSFLAGQVVADLAHLPCGQRWPDIETWAPLGPGSSRGINRLRGIPKDKAVSQAQFESLLPELISIIRPQIARIWDDRKLHAMDIQNCLCEFDKYRRLQLKEGKVRARYDGAAPTVVQDTQLALFG